MASRLDGKEDTMRIEEVFGIATEYAQRWKAMSQ
jgi:hypothetical protein